MLGSLVRCKGRREHYAGVVDEDVGASEFLLDALSRCDDGIPVRNVSLDGNGTVAQFIGKRGDALKAAAQECDPISLRNKISGDGLADSGGCAGDYSNSDGITHNISSHPEL